MYTEMLPGGQLLALIIPSLTETMAGTYYCSASYANTEPLEASVDIQTYGTFLHPNDFVQMDIQTFLICLQNQINII